jgi:homoserine kinase
VGLSARAVLVVGGLVGANNLVGSPFTHEHLIEMAAEITGQPEAVVTAMRGGLGIYSRGTSGLLYRAIEITPLRVVLAVPTLPDYQHRLRDDLPGTVLMEDAVHNIGHTALLIEALRGGDLKLLRARHQRPAARTYRRENIPAYEAVVRAAEEAGAAAVSLCGAGPALLVFATYNHQTIETAIRDAFQAAGIESRTWSVGVDTQGVVISVVE